LPNVLKNSHGLATVDRLVSRRASQAAADIGAIAFVGPDIPSYNELIVGFRRVFDRHSSPRTPDAVAVKCGAGRMKVESDWHEQ
jgi:hypothetical protein